MGIQVVPAGGEYAAEYGILERELETINATEVRIGALVKHGGSIDWSIYPESDGRHVGRVYDAAGTDEGLVIINKGMDRVRVSSYEAFINESKAHADQVFADTLSPTIAVSALRWHMIGARPRVRQSGRPQSGPGIAHLGSEGRLVYVLDAAVKVGNTVRPKHNPTGWLLYTGAEYQAFITGTLANEFDVDDDAEYIEEVEGMEPQVPQSDTQSDPIILDFGARVFDQKRQRLGYNIDERLVSRWVARSVTGHYSAYTNFVLEDFFQRNPQPQNQSVAA